MVANQRDGTIIGLVRSRRREPTRNPPTGVPTLCQTFPFKPPRGSRCHWYHRQTLGFPVSAQRARSGRLRVRPPLPATPHPGALRAGVPCHESGQAPCRDQSNEAQQDMHGSPSRWACADLRLAGPYCRRTLGVGGRPAMAPVVLAKASAPGLTHRLLDAGGAPHSSCPGWLIRYLVGAVCPSREDTGICHGGML